MIQKRYDCVSNSKHWSADRRRYRYLDEIEQAPTPSSIRREKEKFLRETLEIQGSFRKLFSQDAVQAEQEEINKTGISKEKASKWKVPEVEENQIHEAMRVYRLLRPDALPFYKEDAILGMEAKMNRILAEESGVKPGDGVNQLQLSSKYADPFQCHLPVVNPTAFIVALEAATNSISEDLEAICQYLGIHDLPQKDHPLRFQLLVEQLINAFPLRRDPSYVNQFMEDSWPRLKVLLPDEIGELPTPVVAEWLRGHLTRVQENKKAKKKIWMHEKDESEWYNFGEDFVYDTFPMTNKLIDERNLDFPLEKAGEYLRNFAKMFGVAGEGVDSEAVSAQFQQLVWDAEKIGLRNWLKMDLTDLENNLPKGKPPLLEDVSDEDLRVAKIMLKAAARGKPNLLDFEAIDPIKMFSQFPTTSVEEEMAAFPENPYLSDAQIDAMFDVHTARENLTNTTIRDDDLHTFLKKDSRSPPIELLINKDKDFFKKGGPIELTEDSWKWKAPTNAIFDPARNMYIREQEGMDPNLKLSDMRQHLLEIRRMGTMNAVGRNYYYRTYILVGNGKGVYGFGTGFGNTPKEARSDGALKALQNLEFLDFDPSKTMTFPVVGREYDAKVYFKPRAMGRGLEGNHKNLPIMYILGLDNCSMKFRGANQGMWTSRMRAMQRALDQFMSRRTLSNMTGKKHALLVAPGDHWVHWADRWFKQIRGSYDAKYVASKIERRKVLHWKKRSNVVASQLEVLPGWTRHAWLSPMQKWIRRTNLDKGKQRGGMLTLKHVFGKHIRRGDPLPPI